LKILPVDGIWFSAVLPQNHNPPRASRNDCRLGIDPTLDRLEGKPGGRSLAADPRRWNVIYQSASDKALTWWFQDPEIWELLGARDYVAIYGGPVSVGLDAATKSPAAGQWPFWGRVTYCAAAEPDDYPECAVQEVSCDSDHHTLTLVRRPAQ
jgi:hypothetical protein